MWPSRIFRKKSAGPRGQDFLTRNGELLLRKQISFSPGRSNPIRTFTFGELQKATHNFNRWHGGAGDFWGYYWGILDDRTVVVKYVGGYPSVHSEDQLAEALITEIVTLSNIRHRNIVKLLGCCLETRVPLLVYDYEFVPRGEHFCSMGRWLGRAETPPWSARLQIAADVAEALNYLHSYRSRPIVHKNVQASAIVVVDGDCTAKLAGFLYSLPIPLGETQVQEACVSASYGHLAPEYAATGTLTEKVDVHAFGVILIELLTGKLWSCLLGDGQVVSLMILDVISKGEDPREPPVDDVGCPILREAAMTEQRLALEEACLAILVAEASALGDAEGKTGQFRAFARLALRCAHPRGQRRPTMKEAVEELRRIRSMALP